MRGEERFSAALFLIAEVFNGRPSDAQSIKGAGAATDFIQNDQRAAGSIAQDVGRFAHFYHEGGLAACQIVRGADACKDIIDQGNYGLACGYERADVRHQHDQCNLTHVGAFTGHVRAGDNLHAFVIQIHFGVVGNEQTVGHRFFYHRMATVADDQFAVFSDGRADIIVFDSNAGQREQRVQRFEGFG